MHLELQTGSQVVALIKAGWLELLVSDQPATPGHNILEGTIEVILDADDGPSEVRISLPNGHTLCALAEPQDVRNRELAVGQPVHVQFSPSNVLLGTSL